MTPRITTEPSSAQLQLFHLARLYSAVSLARQTETLDPIRGGLLRRAIFSFYRDCVTAGVGTRARQVVSAPAYRAIPD